MKNIKAKITKKKIKYMLATVLGLKSAKKSFKKLTSTFGQVIELLFFNLFICSQVT